MLLLTGGIRVGGWGGGRGLVIVALIDGRYSSWWVGGGGERGLVIVAVIDGGMSRWWGGEG